MTQIKRRGTHTSIMDDAKEVVKIISKISIVKGIAPGIIMSKNSISNSRSIKISYPKDDNQQMISILVCSKIYTQKINILLNEPIDDGIKIIKDALKKYTIRYNINLK